MKKIRKHKDFSYDSDTLWIFFWNLSINFIYTKIYISLFWKTISLKLVPDVFYDIITKDTNFSKAYIHWNFFWDYWTKNTKYITNIFILRVYFEKEVQQSIQYRIFLFIFLKPIPYCASLSTSKKKFWKWCPEFFFQTFET